MGVSRMEFLTWWIAWCAGLPVIYIFYYLTAVVARPKVACGGKRLREAVVEHCPIFFELYWPPLWAFNNHLITILRSKLQHSPKILYKRHMLQLADGGQLALDWLSMETEDTDLPVLLIMPGLTGSSEENYAGHLVNDGESQGFRPVVFNQRGSGGVPMLTPRTYCATNTEDLREVLNHIQSSYPKVPVVGVGISLGGVLLTRYLAETGNNSSLAGIITISTTWDGVESMNGLERFPNRQLYSYHLSKAIKERVRMNMPQITSKFTSLPYDLEEILQGSTIKDFDRSCTIKVFGYPNTTEYYRDGSNNQRLHLVKKPLICIQAEDDPFAPHKTLPYSEFEKNENTVLVTTARGGHFGFMEGVSPFGMTWMNRAVRQSLSALKHLAAIK